MLKFKLLHVWHCRGLYETRILVGILLPGLHSIGIHAIEIGDTSDV